jgi:hypothetical protein
MQLREYFLGCGYRQGDWVEVDNIKGIYIASPSKTKSVIAIKENRIKSYMLVITEDMSAIERPEGGEELFRFARKHLLWQRPVNHRPQKEQHP